jgi:chromosome partitioning protein
LRNVQKVRERYNPRLHLLGVLLGNSDTRAKLDGDIHAMLVRKFGGEHVFDTIIYRSVKHREATVNGQTILEHAAGQSPAEQFTALGREVLARLVAAEEGSVTDEGALREANRG